MTTASDLIERTRRHLYSETRDERNRLSSGVDAVATTLTFDFPLRGVQAGAVLSIDLEELLVWEVGDGTATVARAQNGTVAAVHATGVHVVVNAKVSGFAIFQAINDDLLDLSSPDNGLFRVRTVTVNYDSGTDAYDLSGVTDLIDILEVTYDSNDGSERWPTIARDAWRLRRAQPTSVFASGLSLTINGYAESGAPINVAYKSGFSPLASLSDNVVTTTGMAATMADIPPLGAAVRLMAGSEVARNFLDQGETRRAAEVPAGARNSAPSRLAAVRQQRIAAESARLYAQYPVVKS